MTQPKATRPHMPGYGIATDKAGLLPWSYLEERMLAARNYWLITIGDKRPHAAPVWGVWHKGSFYFSSGTSSRKARNLAANPAVSLHLESGDEVVILEGQIEPVSEPDLLQELDAVYQHKYGVSILGGQVYCLRIEQAFAWREQDFPRTATRWTLR